MFEIHAHSYKRAITLYFVHSGVILCLEVTGAAHCQPPVKISDRLKYVVAVCQYTHCQTVLGYGEVWLPLNAVQPSCGGMHAP